MEHLLASPDVSEIVIPYLGGELFENHFNPEATTPLMLFKAYFLSRGWKLNSVGEIEPIPFSANEILTKTQTSLYFGCIISVFRCLGVSLNTQFWLKDDGRGNRIVSTQNLPNLFTTWRNYEESFAWPGPPFPDVNNPQTVRYSAISEMIAWNYSFLKSLMKEAREKPDAPACPIDAIELSIMALGESLSLAVERIYKNAGPNNRNLVWGPSRILTDKLNKSGWCPSDSPFFPEAQAATSISADYYFGSYYTSRPRGDHACCSKKICTAYQQIVDPETYKPVHTDTCQQQNCQRIFAPSEVADLVRTDGMPVIAWDGETLHVSSVAPDMKYVAISHVWSDGLGNDNVRNWMHRCQLNRLQGLVDNLYRRGTGYISGTVGFWIDTLCIPVGKENVDARSKAIGQMKNIYRESDKTLVLDSSILRLSRTATITEKYIGIHLSNWHHRLWTLQEGQLGKSLYFQFKDGAQSFSDMKFGLNNAGSMEMDPRRVFSPVERLAATELERFYRHFENLAQNQGVDISQRMITCERYLRSRETSRKEDEPLCVSTILGLDPRPLFKARGLDDRMEIFYNMVQRFDPRIIFSKNERHPKHGFRWAPRTLLQGAEDIIGGDLDFSTQRFPVTISPKGGLLLRYPGILLDYNGPGANNSPISITIDPSTVHPISLQKFAYASPEQRNRWASKTPPYPWWFRHFEIKMLPNAETKNPTWQPGVRYAVITVVDAYHSSGTIPAIVGVVESLEDGFIPLEAHIPQSIEQSIAEPQASMWRPTFSAPQIIGIRHFCNATVTLLPTFGYQPEPPRSQFSGWFSGPSPPMQPVQPAGPNVVVPGVVYSEVQQWCVR